jgi:hypothetical protein
VAAAGEAARPLPGDRLVKTADFAATRAITIDAAPEQVAVAGADRSGRAGWYRYDRLDNAGRPAATEIIPGLQQLQSGNLVPVAAGHDVGVWVKELEPDRRMLWWGPARRVQLGMTARAR